MQIIEQQLLLEWSEFGLPLTGELLIMIPEIREFLEMKAKQIK
jgi:hypothetical protein